MIYNITNLINYFICLLVIYWFQSFQDKNSFSDQFSRFKQLLSVLYTELSVLYTEFLSVLYTELAKIYSKAMWNMKEQCLKLV